MPNWTNCPLYDECPSQFKNIMTFCETACNNPKNRELEPRESAILKSFRELVEKVEEQSQLHLDLGDVSPSYIKYFNQGIVKACRAILDQLPQEPAP